MEVKIRELDEYEDDVIKRVLRLRGIKKEDVGKYLFPDDSMKADYNKLVNIEEGLELLHKHIQNKSKMLIVVD